MFESRSAWAQAPQSGFEYFPQLGVKPQGTHEHTLCGLAEGRFMRSMDRGETIVIGEHLLLKFRGRMAALCVEDFIGPGGMLFKKGMLYSPYGKEFRSLLKSEYERGVTKMPLGADTDWAEVRMADQDPSNPLEVLCEIASSYIASVTGELLSPQRARERADLTFEEIQDGEEN